MLAHATLLGATSAGYWTFSRQRVLDAGLSDGWSVGFWVVIGMLGLAGGSAGATAARRGLGGALRRWAAVWAVSLGLLALPTLPGWAALTSAAGFGAAYMALTGLLILWAVEERAEDAAAGVRASFLALGVGQAIATPAVGWLAALGGLPTAFASSAIASAALLFLVPARAVPTRLGGPGTTCSGTTGHEAPTTRLR